MLRPYAFISRRYILFFLCLCLFNLFIYMCLTSVHEETFNSGVTQKPFIIHWKKVKQKYTCHYLTKFDVLPSVDDPNVSFGNNSIFFIETSCRGGINSRIACAVESAARLHPNRQVNFLFTSPITEQMLTNSSLLKLNEFGNVKFSRIYIQEYSKGTVVEEMMSKSLRNSVHPIEHVSDILRMITLHKFGGVYLDTDSILIKNLDSLPHNWISKESDKDISAGIIALSKDGVGKNLSTEFLREIQKTYKPKAWSHNGPKAIQRVLLKLCPQTLLTTDYCGGLKIIPPKYFYPVHYKKHRKYFKNGSIANMYRPYMHHMWNHLTQNLKVEKNSPFAKLAKRFCPTIYDMYGDEFGE